MQPAYREDIDESTKFRWQTIKGIKHYCFRDISEFREFFSGNVPPIAPDWKDADEGDWVVAEDGGVVQILKMAKHMKHPKDTKSYSYANGWCRTVVGTFLIKKNSKRSIFKMDTDWGRHKSRYTFGGTDANLDFMGMNLRTHITKRERKFIFAILFSEIPDVYDIYRKIYPDTKPEYIQARCNNLLAQERIKVEIDKGVKEAADKQGLSHEWVFKKLKHHADKAETDADKIRATIKIGDSLGTFNAAKQDKKQLPGGGAVAPFQEITKETIEQIGARPKQIEESDE